MRSSRTRLVFVKLGGSLITRKDQAETPRPGVIGRLAGEIRRGLASDPGLQMLIGHGSGSFGHIAARRHGTRLGVRSSAEWHGFAEVAAAAARLNRVVTRCFLAAGVPVWSIQPSASLRCRAGEIVSGTAFMETLEAALARGLVPLIYGDVALDEVCGGTILSTEEILSFLARRLAPDSLILAGAVDGVYDRDPLLCPDAQSVPEISTANWAQVRRALGGSSAPDVTGGMLSKVELMLCLVQDVPGLAVRILSGERAGALEAALRGAGEYGGGTAIR